MHAGCVPGLQALLLRAVVVAGLVVTGYVHLGLAATYDGIGQTVTVGDLFRTQGVAAVLTGVLVALPLPWGAHLTGLVLAVLVGAASAAMTTLTTYVRVPATGPLPELYEPVWYSEKALAAVSAGIAAVVAATLLAAGRGRPRASR